jgi:chromosomal replication initiator protein
MNASIWDQILTRIETKVNRHSFYTWFKPTTFLADGGSSITVRVPNPLFKDWLTKHYSGVLAEGAGRSSTAGASLVFVDEGAVQLEESPIEPVASPEEPEDERRTKSHLRVESPLHLRHLHRRAIESVCPCGMPCGR